MPKKLLYLILISTLLRMIAGAALELSNDEVYYVLYALDLQPNYFDHPPGVGILIRLFTGDLHFMQELFIRLGAIVCAAIGTVLCYRLGTLIKNEITGWYAAILYNTSIYTSVIAGTFIIPDSPQTVFWLASLLVVLRIIVRTERDEAVTISQWLLLGLLIGLCIMCKVHGVFIWFGFGLYVVAFQRKLLMGYGIYLAAIVTLIVMSPIVIWNIQNDFITYKFHSDRVAIQESPIHLDYFFQTLGGQLLYNNPVNAFVIGVALWKLRTLNYLSATAKRFLLLSGLPIIITVTIMSLFNPLLPHWSGPGFMVLAFAAAAYLSEKQDASWNLPVSLRISTGLITTAFVAAVILIRFYPGTLGSKQADRYGDGDFTLDMYGWQEFGKQFNAWLEDEKRNKKLPPDIKLVSHKWFPAAHLDYYVASPYGYSVIGVGKAVDLHQYYWLNRQRPPLEIGDEALCIVPSNYSINLDHTFMQYFIFAEPLTKIESKRSGKTARYFDVYLLRGYKGNDEMKNF